MEVLETHLEIGLVGYMILYSYFYWANDGQVLWISQMFIEEKYRKYGVFFKLIEKLKKYELIIKKNERKV